MKTRGFITAAQWLSGVEDADPIFIDLRVTDNDLSEDSDTENSIIEIENAHTNETILLTRDNAAALVEALREILKRYPEVG